MSETGNEPMDGAGSSATQPVEELLLHRYLDGRLEPSGQQSVEERLKGCPASRRKLDALREEAALLRTALEDMNDPPYKISDKVMAVLYARHHQRLALARARRLRNQVLAAVSAAALVMLAVWTLKPREEAGQMVAGQSASVVRGGTGTFPLTPDTLLYENDCVVTARGQFVQLRLAGGTRIDVDEESRLRFERSGTTPRMLLESGSVRVLTGPMRLEIACGTHSGHLRIEPETALELGWARPSGARAPDWAEPWSLPEPESKTPASNVLCLTVLSGVAHLQTQADAQTQAVTNGRRIFFGSDAGACRSSEIHALHALDNRREAWAEDSKRGPQNRPLLGLTEARDWAEWGRQLGLLENVFGAPAAGGTTVQAALGTLAAGTTSSDPETRAALLGQGQQALRSATQGWPLVYENRWYARALEGLAHYERGRALLAAGTPKAVSAAQNAFLASAVAFEEALTGGGQVDPEVKQAPGLAKMGLNPKVGSTSRLREFTPAEQAFFLARFYQPWALYRLRLLAAGEHGTTENTSILERDPEPLFDAAYKLLGRSVEGLGARYGQALARAQAGRLHEALAVFDEIAATSVAALSDRPPSRAFTEGLRQAAHVERARLCLTAGDPGGLEKVLEEFQIRYPLDSETRAGCAMQQFKNEGLLSEALLALRELRFQDACTACTDLLARAAKLPLAPSARWQAQASLLEALIGLQDGAGALRAAQELVTLPAPELDPITRLRTDLLLEKAKALEARQYREGAVPAP